jgi:phosphatidylserine/phosphatidylglycerophosphate/cardiolipin synthase-like enzyme
MKRTAFILILIQLVIIALAMLSQANAAPYARPAVYTQCNGNAHKAIIEEINAATSTIRCMLYSFNDLEIADALQNAQLRGIDVKIIMDRGQFTKNKTAQYIYSSKSLNMKLDSAETIMHMKLCIIDTNIIILGSYNWTRAARIFYAEVLYICTNSTLAQELTASFNYHDGHSTAPPSNLKTKTIYMLNPDYLPFPQVQEIWSPS